MHVHGAFGAFGAQDVQDSHGAFGAFGAFGTHGEQIAPWNVKLYTFSPSVDNVTRTCGTDLANAA